VSIDRKESGIGLWIKSAFRLTSNRARTVRALDDVSFQIEAGEIFGIYGANGAGKTTLIKILSGLLLPESGSERVNGCTGIDEIKDQISYISTNGWMGLEWQLTVYENLMLYGHIFGIPTSELRRRCDSVLGLFGMVAGKDKHISELSAGMRQKVTLMRGFLLDRPILYLDEPTVSLDVQSSAALRQILVDAARRDGKTVIVTSHNPVDLSICRRIMLLYAGHVIALGCEAELASPLQGIKALRLTCANHQSGDGAADLVGGLLQLDVVRDVQVSEGNGRENTWRVDLLVHRDGHAASEIIDWFIARDMPIVRMRSAPLTLQELYAYHVDRTTLSGGLA